MPTMPSFDGKEDSPLCHGTGTLYDWVPYGMGNVQMPTGCDCIGAQQDEWEEAEAALRAEFDALEMQDDDLTPAQNARYTELHRVFYGR